MKEELLEKAKSLGLEVDDYDDEESLQRAIEEKEKENRKKEEDEDEDKEKDIDFWKSEAKLAFESRDKAKKELRLVKSKIKTLEEKLSSSVDPEEYKNLKSKLDELLNEKREREEEEERKRLEKADEVEKIKIRSKKEIEAMQKEFESKFKELNNNLNKFNEKLSEKEAEINNLRRLRLENEIMDSAVEFKAYNPKQIVRLLSGDFEYDETLGKFTYPVKDEKGKLIDEKTVKERVKEFLSDPENDNLVESKANIEGTGHKKSVSKDVEGDKSKFGDYDPKDPSIVEEAEFRGLEPEQLISIWRKRDEKLKRIKERRES